ncbi:MAG TPA: choice-of-anchor D domain-containing protein, partial [Polyangia bacterium]|nr:choice-of-anchor D domain-containing protein [Polyangia bacterium]
MIFAFGLLGCDSLPGAPAVERVVAAETADAEGTMSADSLRTGFYPNQPALDPATVGSPYFGQLFDAALDGQIYAQPLYANGVLFVATESNHVYALDAATGAPLWTRTLGAPFQASDLNCGDLTPTIGVTGTPVIDSATGTAYLLSKTYANGSNGATLWFAHAFDLETGDERDGFPVVVAGAASNAPTKVFDAERQMQRPGLLLMNGVVYAAFGAHCDEVPYAGWVVGISTKGAIQTLWTTEAGPALNGGGIWQSGGGLVSDGDGQILFATGNDWTGLPGPVSGRAPPATLGEAIVRLSVQPDGALAATDFFSPANRDALNNADADVGSGAPIGLPESFGTSSHPNLLVQAGKFGAIYLLDRDDLGGYKGSADGDDRVLQRVGPGGGVWSRPSVWPGDGGWVYVPVVANCTPEIASGCLLGLKAGVSADGAPMLSQDSMTSSTFAYGSSAAVVTADGTSSGSALLWTVWSSGWTGTGGELRAYDAVPQNGTFNLRYLAGIGTSAKFTAPAVGDGRIYVGTRDGHVVGFGVTGAPALRAQGAAFAPTLVGDEAFSTVQVTAAGAVTVVGLGISGDFALTAASPETPFAVAAGASFAIPVVFRPTTEGAIVGTLHITTDGGSFAIPLSGVGQSAVPMVTMTPPVLTFSPVVMGNVSTETVTITNVSSAPVTLTAITPPAAPFSLSGLPDVGAVLDAGESFIATIAYAPTTIGTSSGYFSVAAGDAVAAMAVEGSALMGGKLRIEPQTLDSGSYNIGEVSTSVFQISNEGDVAVVIEKSKPPTAPAFQPVAPFDEGTVLAPGASIEQLVRVAPTVVGVVSDQWQLNANDGQGLRLVTFSVTGVMPQAPPPATTGAAGAAAATGAAG